MNRRLKQRSNQQRRQKRNIQETCSNTHCPHGFDVACLLCGFGRDEQGDRRWAKWTGRGAK